MSFEHPWLRIPKELVELPQWCVADVDGKPLYLNLESGQLANASVTDRYTWTTFNLAAVQAESFSTFQRPLGIGFILTAEDPFICIDLDVVDEASQRRKGKPVDPSKWTTQAEFERNYRIVREFKSYTEFSRHERGMHIWLRGPGIGKGMRRDNVEIYSQERFIICTGNRLADLSHIVQNDALLGYLIADIGRTPEPASPLIEEPETEADGTIWFRAAHAENAEKFKQLCDGKWAELGYPSQSEADHALIQILAFYTRSNEQVRRMFRATKLVRPKSMRDAYIDRSLALSRADQQARDNQARQAEVVARGLAEEYAEHLRKQDEERQRQHQISIDISSRRAQDEDPDTTLPWPPGACGDIARYLYSTVTMPIPEVAIIATLGYLAGVFGRTYNTPGLAGLNLYFTFIAKSGSGKDGLHDGVNKLVEIGNAVNPAARPASRFAVEGDIASAQALRKVLGDKPSFVHLYPEFGKDLHKWSMDDKASAEMLKKVVGYFTRSGYRKSVGGMAYSDKEKDVGELMSPAYSIIGECTPSLFGESLTRSMLEDGLVSRLLLYEYKGERPRRNKEVYGNPDSVIADVIQGYIICSTKMEENNSFVRVEQHPNVIARDDEVEEYHRQTINRVEENEKEEAIRALHNRSHLKIHKIASILAVADNPMMPVMTLEHFEWARMFVERSNSLLLAKFESGDIGISDDTRSKKLISIIENYLRRGAAPGYKVNPQLQEGKILTFSFLAKSTNNQTAFKNYRQGANLALEHTIQALLAQGALVEIDKKQLENYSYRGRAFRYLGQDH